MDESARRHIDQGARLDQTVRDPLAQPQLVRAARERSMAERLELALSWNSVAAELRLGMKRQSSASGDGR